MSRNPIKHHSDFPTLANERRLVYLDSAATSLTPEPVLSAMDEYYRTYRASTHRGLYETAVRATEAYEKARADVARFIGADTDEVVFTSGATGSANMLTYALEHTLDLREGDEIVTTVMEHHAALLPLQELAKRKKLKLRHIPLDGLTLSYDAATELITDRTKIVSLILASNVVGTVNDVRRIAQDAHEKGALALVDATVAVGHMPVSVKALDCDFLYFSGHKMCGPTGIGVLYGKTEKLKNLKPGFFGGGMVDTVSLTDATYTASPHRFEAGTPNIAGAIGFGTAVTYLESIGVDAIHTHVRELVTYTQDMLSRIPGLTLYSAAPEENVGIVSFTLEGIHAHDIAQVCADHGVAIRAGHHCAQPLHAALGVPATARASFYLYNTKEDAAVLERCIHAAAALFQV